MFRYVCEFVVASGREAEFEAVYGQQGPWVELFQRDPAFLGTELCRDVANPRRYFTFDRWTSYEACRTFRERSREEYEALDATCRPLVAEERYLGDFERVE